MPRTTRAIIAGCCYHVINRANAGLQIFNDRADYLSFLSLLNESQKRLHLPLLAACLMPNHVHFVVRPRANADIARWTHWLFTTHVRRHHLKYKTYGRIWQGRFKAFLIEQDRHLLTVLRYVERNAVRAKLVDRAERWHWGSLCWRTQIKPPIGLAPSPVGLPSNWVDYVNAPQSPAELEAIRSCINSQRPLGDIPRPRGMSPASF
jgi:putative transposase